MVKPFTKVLVGTDFSDGSGRAVERAADLAQRYGARLHIVHVWELPHVATSLMFDPGFEWHTPVEQAAKAARRAARDAASEPRRGGIHAAQRRGVGPDRGRDLAALRRPRGGRYPRPHGPAPRAAGQRR